jgi:hypothetical protein
MVDDFLPVACMFAPPPADCLQAMVSLTNIIPTATEKEAGYLAMFLGLSLIKIQVHAMCSGGVLEVDTFTAEQYSPHQLKRHVPRCKHLPRRVHPGTQQHPDIQQHMVQRQVPSLAVKTNRNLLVLVLLSQQQTNTHGGLFGIVSLIAGGCQPFQLVAAAWL